MKPVGYYKDREQTYLKHFFLERYLETVAYHIGYSQKEFVYVDCFSGPWRAEDEELGDTSIRIALDRLNSVRNGLAQRQKYPSIRAIFVEKSPTAFATLKQVLQEHGATSRRQRWRGVSKRTSAESSTRSARHLRSFSSIRPDGAALRWTTCDRSFSARRAR